MGGIFWRKGLDLVKVDEGILESRKGLALKMGLSLLKGICTTTRLGLAYSSLKVLKEDEARQEIKVTLIQER